MILVSILVDMRTMDDLIRFIEDEMKKRDMSIRAFARLCDISKTQMASVLNGTQTPGLQFIHKLADGTNTNINTIVAFIFPDQSEVDPEIALLAERIANLSADDRRIAEAFVLGLALKRLQQRTERDDVLDSE